MVLVLVAVLVLVSDWLAELVAVAVGDIVPVTVFAPLLILVIVAVAVLVIVLVFELDPDAAPVLLLVLVSVEVELDVGIWALWRRPQLERASTAKTKKPRFAFGNASRA